MHSRPVRFFEVLQTNSQEQFACTGRLARLLEIVLVGQRMDRRQEEKITLQRQYSRADDGLSLAESSLAQTLVAFMERVVSLTFVRRIPLARVLNYAQAAVYNFLTGASGPLKFDFSDSSDLRPSERSDLEESNRYCGFLPSFANTGLECTSPFTVIIRRKRCVY
ncbi:uncharacterized protein ARMOST_06312 [Armillaria ostoyae]|uniref:Uncharacterized protein n=1 Tax=Armillaria ostoyae TaxID=47428 RepID=A0A284R2L4_ARMOS|nr:uncharacterized protein ARMOST_06312 [Armillaria ostoyae]